MKLTQLNPPQKGGINYWVDLDSFKSKICFYKKLKIKAKYCSITVFCNKCKKSQTTHKFWMDASPDTHIPGSFCYHGNDMGLCIWYEKCKENMSNGWKINSSEFICPVCTKTEIEKRLKKSYVPEPCEICGKPISYEEAIKMHMICCTNPKNRFCGETVMCCDSHNFQERCDFVMTKRTERKK